MLKNGIHNIFKLNKPYIKMKLERILKGIKGKIILLTSISLLTLGLYSCNSNTLPTSFPQTKNYSTSVKTNLESELLKQLKAKGISINKTTSKPPKGEGNKVDDLTITDNDDGTYTLKWSYKNVGDYNQDSVVDIKDITPLAFYFQQQANETNEWIDGNQDGVIDIKDITPLASNFGTDCAGYSVEKADSEMGSFTEIKGVSFSQATGNGRKTFDTNLETHTRQSTFRSFL